MKYFLDTEFVEGKPNTATSWLILKRRCGGLMFGLPKPTIDLISIGIVCEDGREYYAISNEFDIKEAWNRWQDVAFNGSETNINYKIGDPRRYRKYWLRDNVLKSIFIDLTAKQLTESGSGAPVPTSAENHFKFNKVFAEEMTKTNLFSFKHFKNLIAKHGKSNKQIAEEIKDFISYKDLYGTKDSILIEGMTSEQRSTYSGRMELLKRKKQLPEFYGYYCDYDWVAFCWLFGTMVNLPKGFPMHCIDLKQILDDKCLYDIYICQYKRVDGTLGKNTVHIDDPDAIMTLERYKKANTEERLAIIKSLPNYPKQSNEHNALDDAKWNFQLFNFLNEI